VRLSRRHFASSSLSQKWLITVCLLLILISAVVQAIHIHPIGSAAELKDCPFCQVATTTAVAILILLLFCVLGTTAFITFAPDAECKPVLCSSNLFSRPPPAA